MNLSSGYLQKLKIVLPPQEEQGLIVQYLQEQLTSIDRLLVEVKQMAEILQERRSALISATVTGKIDVRDWQPPEGDSVELTADTEAA